MVSKFQRARKDEDKRERRGTILRCARKLFEKKELPEIRMEEIAKTAKLAKGTLFLYFPTKEKLFLDLLDDLFTDWFQDLKLKFESDQESISDLVVKSLSERPTLKRLLPLLSNVLEMNVSDDEIIEFKSKLVRHLHSFGRDLEARFKLPPGQGAPLLMRIYALIVGLQHTSRSSARMEKILDRPEFQILKMDFDSELKAGIDRLLRSLD